MYPKQDVFIFPVLKQHDSIVIYSIILCCLLFSDSFLLEKKDITYHIVIIHGYFIYCLTCFINDMNENFNFENMYQISV